MSHTPNYVQQVSHTLAELLPDCDDELLGLYTLLALTRGRATTLANVHDAWAVWRCATNPGHRSIVPFGQLAPDVKELDRPYRLAIHRAAEAVNDLDVTTVDGRREGWLICMGVGGHVCAEPEPARPDGICGMPVETEPCDIHHPAVPPRPTSTKTR